MKIKKKRADAAKKLNVALPQYFYALERDDQILQHDVKRILKLKADLKSKSHVLPTDLLQYKDVFQRYAAFKFFSLKELRRIAQFMSLEPVTGFNLLNNLIRLFTLKKFEINLEWPIVRNIA